MMYWRHWCTECQIKPGFPLWESWNHWNHVSTHSSMFCGQVFGTECAFLRLLANAKPLRKPLEWLSIRSAIAGYCKGRTGAAGVSCVFPRSAQSFLAALVFFPLSHALTKIYLTFQPLLFRAIKPIVRCSSLSSCWAKCLRLDLLTTDPNEAKDIEQKAIGLVRERERERQQSSHFFRLPIEIYSLGAPC